MDTTSSPADIPSQKALAEISTHGLEEYSQLEGDDVYKYCNCNTYRNGTSSRWSPDDSEGEIVGQMDFVFTDANPAFDLHGMKARRASLYAVQRSHTAIARRQRTTKRDASRANRTHEPIGSRNDVWREGLEKGALATYVRRRCRCEYCVHQTIFTQERRTLRWAVRRAEQGRDWGTNQKPRWPRWVDYDWDVESGDGDAGDSWDGAESVLRPGRVPPMEANLSELIRIRRPQSRRAAQSILLPYSDFTLRETNRSLSATEAEPSIKANPPISGFGPLRCDDAWELLSLYSEWDGCSVQSI